MSNPFKEGDFVILKKGWTVMKVVEVDGPDVLASYGPNSCPTNHKLRHYMCFRPASEADFLPTSETKNHWKDTEMTQKKLYSWTDGTNTFFGYKLAQDSSGAWVMEHKGGGGVQVVAKEDLERVMPYTVTAKSVQTSREHSFCAKAGEVSKGDIVLMPDGAIVQITALDTKSENASHWLKGLVLQGKKLTGE